MNPETLLAMAHINELKRQRDERMSVHRSEPRRSPLADPPRRHRLIIRIGKRISIRRRESRGLAVA